MTHTFPLAKNALKIESVWGVVALIILQKGLVEKSIANSIDIKFAKKTVHLAKRLLIAQDARILIATNVCMICITILMGKVG